MAPTLSGTLNAAGKQLTGTLSVRSSTSPYTGSYEATPKVVEQTIPTAGKTMARDFIIRAVPFHETTNPSDGLTVHIAEEA